jgi:hypothetical protein
MQPKYFKIGNKVMYVDQIGNMRQATKEEIENNYIIEPNIIVGPVPVIRDIYKYEKKQALRNETTQSLPQSTS